jgi:hypothetical protein
LVKVFQVGFLELSLEVVLKGLFLAQFLFGSVMPPMQLETVDFDQG